MRLNTIKPAAGSKREHLRVGARRLGGPGQDLRPRRQGPARAQGRLSQGRVRGRPDAAAAASAEDRLPLGHEGLARRAALHDLMRVKGGEVTLAGLIEASLVPEQTKLVKIILSGKVSRAYVVKDKVITATKGAKSAVESAGGRFEA
jgi:large subunit ribosomal protein L15